MQSKKTLSKLFNHWFWPTNWPCRWPVAFEKIPEKCVSFSIKFVVFKLIGVSSEIPHVKDPVQEVKPE